MFAALAIPGSFQFLIDDVRFEPEVAAQLVMVGHYAATQELPDSYIEEWFPMQNYFGDAGYDVVSFEAPGQGATLHEGHLCFTHEWHKPVGARTISSWTMLR
jgi:hypothetical protein